MNKINEVFCYGNNTLLFELLNFKIKILFTVSIGIVFDTDCDLHHILHTIRYPQNKKLHVFK